jgi:hypothetical protein
MCGLRPITCAEMSEKCPTQVEPMWVWHRCENPTNSLTEYQKWEPDFNEFPTKGYCDKAIRAGSLKALAELCSHHQTLKERREEVEAKKPSKSASENSKLSNLLQK